MSEPLTLALVGLVFLIAGTVKGLVGFGLPTVSLALLSLTLGLPEAMSLLLVPSLATNLWQSLAGGGTAGVLKRILPFLLLAGGSVWLGALALTRIDLALLSGLLGVLLILYAGTSLAGLRLRIGPGRERWLGPLLGLVNGVLTGMTGSFVVPGVLYLQALDLPRAALLQAMGMLFTVSTLALALALGGNGFLTLELGALSAAALLPALFGMALGQLLGRGMPEAIFRRVFLTALFLLGAAIVAKAGLFF